MLTLINFKNIFLKFWIKGSLALFILSALTLNHPWAIPIGPNLIQNGSFELGPSATYLSIGGNSDAITYWQTTQSGVERWAPAVYGEGYAQNGVFAIDLANYIYTGGGIKQTISTVAGQNYELDFLASTIIYDGRLGTGTIDLFLNGALEKSFQLENFSSLLIWQNLTHSFMANSSNTTLEFRNSQDPFKHFAFMDNVHVGQAAYSSVPEPSSLALVLAGLIVLYSRYRENKKSKMQKHFLT